MHPTIEAVAAIIGGAAFAVEPLPSALTGAILGWALLTLAALDMRHYWLPDAITLPLVLLGLGVAFMPGLPGPVDAAIGAAAGFLFFLLVAWTYRRLRGREGLGGGDGKLFAGSGAWLGWQFLPFVLLAASSAALAVAVVRRLCAGRAIAGEKIPFGAYLALATILLWFVRNRIPAILP